MNTRIDVSYSTLGRIADIARAVGDAIVSQKPGSPRTQTRWQSVTRADVLANDLIHNALLEWNVGVPVISEERQAISDPTTRQDWEPVLVG